MYYLKLEIITDVDVNAFKDCNNLRQILAHKDSQVQISEEVISSLKENNPGIYIDSNIKVPENEISFDRD